MYGIRNQGGGGSNLDNQIALQNNAFYNNMVLAAMQNGQQMPTINPYTTGATSGIAAGTAAGIGAGLR